MRPLPMLGLLAGLVMLGWGVYSLYARFEGGPEVYWGRDNVKDLAEKEDALRDMRAVCEKDQENYREYEARLAAMPAGPEKAAFGQDRDAIANAVTNRQTILKDCESFARLKVTERDLAQGRALRRGILFTLLGLVWSFRAGAAVFAATKPRPSTAALDPSPPSPRPGD
jgi:hypothetical protein